MKSLKTKIIIGVILILIGLPILANIVSGINESNPAYRNRYKDRYFKILSNEDNKSFESNLMDFAKKEKIDLLISYADDLEAIDKLESNPSDYDAVWMSNSTWIYM